MVNTREQTTVPRTSAPLDTCPSLENYNHGRLIPGRVKVKSHMVRNRIIRVKVRSCQDY